MKISFSMVLYKFGNIKLLCLKTPNKILRRSGLFSFTLGTRGTTSFWHSERVFLWYQG